MKQEPKFYWDDTTKTATCILADGNNIFTGIASVHPDDMDMANEKTGYQIALWRAEIKYYTHIRDNELKPALKALKKVLDEMKYSKKFNPKSYENKSLQRNLYQIESDLDTVRDLLTNTKQKLKQYISEKEKFYQKIRANRTKKDDVGQKPSL